MKDIPSSWRPPGRAEGALPGAGGLGQARGADGAGGRGEFREPREMDAIGRVASEPRNSLIYGSLLEENPETATCIYIYMYTYIYI